MEYAIDFGTSNTVVARVNQSRELETVKVADYSSFIVDNPPLIPSFVYVQDAVNGQVLIGQEVSDRGLDNRSTKENIKSEARFLKLLNGRSAPICHLCLNLMGAKWNLNWWENGF